MALDLSLRWHQQELQRSARELLTEVASAEALRAAEDSVEGFLPATHRQMAQLGWLGIGLHAGLPTGRTDDAIDLIVLYEELGRAALPGPHFFSQLACRLLLHIEPEGSEALVQDLVHGHRIGTVALYEPNGEMQPLATVARATAAGDFVISGVKGFVPYSSAADVILVLAETEEETVDFFLVEGAADGITLFELHGLTGEPMHGLQLDGVHVPQDARLGPPDSGLAALDRSLPWAYLAQAAELVGLAEASLEMAVEYAKDRVAFGRPIGSFQAIQHMCAEMLADCDAARYVTYNAACLLGDNTPEDPRVIMAKAFAGEAARQVTKAAHQIFAGAGFVLGNKLNHYYRRAKAIEMTLGGTDVLFDRIADGILGPITLPENGRHVSADPPR